MTTEQRLLNLFMEEYYPELAQHFGNRDSLHTAYVMVFETPNPLMLRRGTFGHRVGNAYSRDMKRERRHSFRFILPDPVFWLLHEDIPDEQPQDDGRTIEEEEREKRNVKSFLRTMFSNEEVIVYCLIIEKGYDIREVCEVTGWLPSKVNELLSKMDDAIRNNYHKPKHKGRKDSK